MYFPNTSILIDPVKRHPITLPLLIDASGAARIFPVGGHWGAWGFRRGGTKMLS